MEHLQELEQLACTRGIVVLKKFIQALDRPTLTTFIGSGKVEEIRIFIQENHVNLVIFDDDLNPSQVKNLEKTWQCNVWDRSYLILEIFAMNARTAQAKIQVELAQYEYLLPRLAGMWTHLSRQEGRIGTRGPGEKELETDKRIAQNKIQILKHKLAHIEKIAHTKRKQRTEHLNVALVGYTNVGKSTLMQSLSKKEVLVEDKLFATLSPTVRRVVIQDIHFLLADTVGFIRKLPTQLIESFKSTLSEACKADLLLHVADISHSGYIQHIEIVHKILEEIGAQDIPIILVLNKVDRIRKKIQEPTFEQEGQFDWIEAQMAELQRTYLFPVVCCSAVDGDSLLDLKKLSTKNYPPFGPVVQWIEQKFPKL